jgi:hypothetical protein
MGDGTKENPYTREDVLRLIKENGGTAKELDLSGKIFEGDIDLQGLDLSWIILKDAIFSRYAHLEKADLLGAHLENAYLNGAHLEGAILVNAHLEGTQLREAHLERARLFGAHLEGAFLREAHLEGTFLETVDWGNFILYEEKEVDFQLAEHIYRRLKQWHTNTGIYDIAGEFFFREMTAKRKALKWWPNPFPRVWSKLLSILCGYGERPLRVIASAAAIVFGLALLYFIIGTLTPNTFLNSLYYSAVSFTALGYGSWAPEPVGWVKGFGAFEAFLGVFMMALFLVTFTRKMTR